MSVKIETAIVTGASTGLGLAITQTFLVNGINVVMNSVNNENLQAAYKSLGSPANAVLVAGDVSDKAISGLLVAAAVDKFGGVDVLVNNAGIFSPKPFFDTEEADLDRYFAVNFNALGSPHGLRRRRPRRGRATRSRLEGASASKSCSMASRRCFPSRRRCMPRTS